MKRKLAREPREQLENRLGHRFTNRALLDQALTHGSAVAGNRQFGYERLEFLGDRILGAIVASLVFRSYPQESEGKLTLRQVDLVRNETIAAIARELEIERLVHLSPGEERRGANENESVLADVLEALIGAIYLDGDYKQARQFVERYWLKRMKAVHTPPQDAKSRLQEWLLGHNLTLPVYTVVSMTGPDHAPDITVEISHESGRRKRATGSSRRQAETAAAQQLLDELIYEAAQQ